MIRYKLHAISFSLALLLCGVGLVTSLEAEGKAQTGKTNLEQAKQLGKTWQADAVLIHIVVTTAKEDGAAEPGLGGWMYGFYSPKSKKWYGVHVRKEGLNGRELSAGQTQPITGDFVDSDKAMAEARKNGFKPDKKENLMSLHYFSEGKMRGTYWIVRTGEDSIDAAKWYFMDSKTGKFVSRGTGK